MTHREHVKTRDEKREKRKKEKEKPKGYFKGPKKKGGGEEPSQPATLRDPEYVTQAIYDTETGDLLLLVDREVELLNFVRGATLQNRGQFPPGSYTFQLRSFLHYEATPDLAAEELQRSLRLSDSKLHMGNYRNSGREESLIRTIAANPYDSLSIKELTDLLNH